MDEVFKNAIIIIIIIIITCYKILTRPKLLSKGIYLWKFI